MKFTITYKQYSVRVWYSWLAIASKAMTVRGKNRVLKNELEWYIPIQMHKMFYMLYNWAHVSNSAHEHDPMHPK